MNLKTSLSKQSKKEWRKKYSLALQGHLKNRNWDKVEEILPAAENIGVSARQLHKTWAELGVQHKSQDKLVSALVSFAAARKHDIDNPQLFIEITECLSGFIDRFENKFSQEDLAILQFSYNRVLSFYKLSYLPKVCKLTAPD